MSLAFYFDHHVQRPIARGLRRLQIDVLTAEEDGTKRRPDDSLLARATELGRIFVSNDRDLPAIAARWSEQGRDFAGLVHLTVQRIPYGKAIEDLHLIAEGYAAEEMANRIEYIPY